MRGDKFRLSFSNGEVREVVRRPIHQLRAEAVSGSTTGSMSYLYASFWAADTGGKGDRRAFEAWVDGLDDFDLIPDDGEEPAPLGHGADTSHD